jgi:hypothetical protein
MVWLVIAGWACMVLLAIAWVAAVSPKEIRKLSPAEEAGFLIIPEVPSDPVTQGIEASMSSKSYEVR